MDVDAPNVRARTRSSRAITPATVQAARDQRLCGAKTRKGFPCVRRVVPGRNRCPNHGGTDHRTEDRRGQGAHRSRGASAMGAVPAGARAVTGAIIVGAVVAGVLATIMLGALVAVIVIACMDAQDGRHHM